MRSGDHRCDPAVARFRATDGEQREEPRCEFGLHEGWFAAAIRCCGQLGQNNDKAEALDV